MKIQILIVLNVIMFLNVSINIQAMKIIKIEDEISVCTSPSSYMFTKILNRNSIDDGKSFR